MDADRKTAESPKPTPTVLHVAPWAVDMVLIFEAQANQSGPRFFRATDPRELAAGQQILALGLPELTQIVTAIASRLKEINDEHFRTTRTQFYGTEVYLRWMSLRELARHILRRHLPWSQEGLAGVIAYGAENALTYLPYALLLRQVEHAAEARGIEDSLAGALRRLAMFLNSRTSTREEERKLKERLERLIAGTAKPHPV